MKHGDFLLINFTGKVKNTGEVFDLTDAEEAKKLKIYNEKQKYGPQLVIIGTGDVVPGVERELKKMKVGEERSFDVSQNEAFGKRNLSLIKVLSAAKFFKKNINPVPGLFVDIDGMACRIMAVSGGRVRVDFNHPLAGKDLSYRVKIVKKISNKKEKIESILERFGLKGTVSVKGEKAELAVEKKPGPAVEKLVTEFVKKWVGVKDVSFV